MDNSGESPVERRKYARLDIALSVNYVVKDSSGEITEMAEAMSSDISATGIRLMTPTPLENGSTLDLEITIEGQDNDPVYASCEVVWQNKISDTSYEVGAVISHIEEDDKRRFLEFVFNQMSQLVGIRSTQMH
jgi:c-di-GMP-binding flagellar brake protein YcgR